MMMGTTKAIRRGKCYRSPGEVREARRSGYVVVVPPTWFDEGKAWWHRRREAAARRVRSLRAAAIPAYLEELDPAPRLEELPRKSAGPSPMHSEAGG